MVRVAFVGCGAMGSLYAQTFRKLGHEVYLSVDPRSEKQLGCHHYLRIHEIPDHRWREIDLLVLSAPTDQHLTELRRIAQRSFSGLVLLEKPYVLPHQIAELREFLQDEGRSLRLFFSDPYNQIPIIENLSSLWNLANLKRIDVEFSKNRLADEAAGRFVDHDFGVLGYEYFHMLSIVGQVLRTPWRAEIKSLSIAAHRADVLLRDPARSLDIRLSSAMDGEIFQRDLHRADVFPSADLRSPSIAVGSAFRYRKASFYFTGDESIHLVFERHFGNAELDYKNIHSILVCQGERITDVIDFHFHMLERQVQNAILALRPSAPNAGAREAKLRTALDSHRMIHSFREGHL
ncbi:MAG TPA: Gfo/Idh/MocA family oxidoreductase [Bdellovibrionota bacterium]|nr:Gfo/Idh/MocA family oxidoreductase [Bdellovibrionota bacterium]